MSLLRCCCKSNFKIVSVVFQISKTEVDLDSNSNGRIGTCYLLLLLQAYQSHNNYSFAGGGGVEKEKWQLLQVQLYWMSNVNLKMKSNFPEIFNSPLFNVWHLQIRAKFLSCSRYDSPMSLKYIWHYLLYLKVKTTSPNKYVVKPHKGTIPRNGSVKIAITLLPFNYKKL